MDGSFSILLIGGIHRYVPVYYIIPKLNVESIVLAYTFVQVTVLVGQHIGQSCL